MPKPERKKSATGREVKAPRPSQAKKVATPKRRAGSSRPAEAAPPKEQCPIVAIGGSAGGLEAIQDLLRALPPDTGMAFVYIQHLSAEAPSMLTKLLARATKMQLNEIRDGMRVEPNNVYVVPGGKIPEITGGVLRLSDIPSGNHLSLPIDQFFSSLAREAGQKAVAVVLSGTGSDGTRGLTSIKSEGGLTFAQSEKSAKHFNMPGSAIAAGVVDAILDAPSIAQRLAEFARHRKFSGDAGQETSLQSLDKIFQVVRQHTGVDFALYKRSTMFRRITRRMILHRVTEPGAYAKMLRSDEKEIDALFNDLLIHVTSFFRDKQVFQSLARKIFPKIIRNRKTTGGEIRIWVPGCATGEEVYSVAITLVECMQKLGRTNRVQIFGTDLSEIAITKARNGLYPASALEAVSPERIRKFFVKVNDQYQISRAIRDICTFARQNVPQDPPFSRLDLISCRNVLIYLGPDLQRRCLPIFHYSLNSDGYLLLGTAETVGNFGELFTLVDKRCKIYQKRLTPVRPDVAFGLTLTPQGHSRPQTPHKRDQGIQGEIHRAADRVVMSQTAPSGVVVNSQLQVVQFRGKTVRYLEHTSGEASLNVLQLVNPALLAGLRAGIQRALKRDAPVICEDVPMPHDGRTLLVTMEIVPFGIAQKSSERWVLVLFSSRPSPSDAGTATRKSRPPQKNMLEQMQEELRATRESLQAIIEEQEATNEELKSANEEIESSNEELQSSNEELETAKEELQSTNEELQTLNEELANRNNGMTQVNNDLQNLLASINLPIVMVDDELKIRRVTPQAEKLFNIIPTDIGRGLGDLKSNLCIENIDDIIRGVIDTLQTRELGVQDREGRTYSMRIRPYRTRESKIDGAVLTLFNIDALKLPKTPSGLSGAKLQAILDLMSGPALVVSAEGVIRHINAAFRNAFKIRIKGGQKPSLFDSHGSAWNVPALREAIRYGSSIQRVSMRNVDFHAVGRLSLKLHIVKLEESPNRLSLIHITVEKARK